MFKYTLSAFITFFFLVGSSHASCKLEKGEKLKIGCTSNCDPLIKKSLKLIAKKKKYKIDILDMYNANLSYDLSTIDGMIIPGGVDVDPKHYKYKVEADLRARIEELDYLVAYTRDGARRDPFELQTLNEYFSKKENANLPLLAICRGMQILSVSQGIPLYVDIKKELGIKNRRHLLDNITIFDRSSLIGSVLQYDNFLGYKNHHQGLRVDYFKKYQKTRWPEIQITSESNNGLIAESIEFQNRPIIATQFHPEKDKGLERNRIFDWILDESCKNKKAKNSLL